MTATADMPLLFTPLTIKSVTIPNRIMVSPMCQYHSIDGAPTGWQAAHLGRLAMGAPGIMFGEETAVEARGRKTYECAGIWQDRHIPLYRQLTDFQKSLGTVPAVQLGHCGRKAGCNGAVKDWAPLGPEDAAEGRPPWPGLAPSAIPYGPGFMAPKAMDAGDMRAVLDAFYEATRRALEAGYEIVEIHGAHGYLLHQFVSPVTNRRNDAYGGDRAGRMRFPLEVVETVRRAWPDDKPLFYRLSAVDGAGGIWNLEDSVALSHELKARGVDMIDCSSGGIPAMSDMPPLPRVPGYQVPFAARIKQEVGIPTIAVGLITDAAQAEAILQGEKADIAALARELLWHSDWPLHAARDLGVDPFALQNREYAHRLEIRERAKTMPINQGGDETAAAFDALAGPGVRP